MNIAVEGNNGGDFLEATVRPGGEIEIKVGHCCVVHRHVIVPVSILTFLLSRVDFETVEVDHDPDRKLNQRVRDLLRNQEATA